MPTPDLQVHEIKTLPLRAVFAREDTTFTPWLAQPQNLARLSRAVGIELQLIATEVRLTEFRTDILAEDVRDGSRVVIENQFNRSDHDHLGKALTWLNANTPEDRILAPDACRDPRPCPFDQKIRERSGRTCQLRKRGGAQATHVARYALELIGPCTTTGD